MFHRWGFLLSEIWLLLALAALIGLLAGWLIWARRAAAVADTSEADRLRADLATCTARGTDLAAKVAVLERDLGAAEARAKVAEDKLGQANLAAAMAQAEAPAPMAAMAAPIMAAAVAPIMAPAVAPVVAASVASDAGPAVAPLLEQPKGLTAARGGVADDLKLIKGVGPKLEILCHTLGFFHFDQIAGWTAAEIAWVDENLEGFKGRVTRDEWVEQARELAAGKPPRSGGEH
jgi:predicted flap endonuclease-1-like 5' DNA nuclease